MSSRARFFPDRRVVEERACESFYPVPTPLPRLARLLHLLPCSTLLMAGSSVHPPVLRSWVSWQTLRLRARARVQLQDVRLRRYEHNSASFIGDSLCLRRWSLERHTALPASSNKLQLRRVSSTWMALPYVAASFTSFFGLRPFNASPSQKPCTPGCSSIDRDLHGLVHQLKIVFLSLLPRCRQFISSQRYESIAFLSRARWICCLHWTLE